MDVQHMFASRVGVCAPRPIRHPCRLNVKPKGKEFDNGVPPWKRFQKRVINRQVEKTLETVWERTQWPSDEVISSMWDLHRLRRDHVIDWFSQKRLAVRKGGRGASKTSGAISDDNESQEEKPWPKTNWDDEWTTERPDM